MEASVRCFLKIPPKEVRPPEANFLLHPILFKQNSPTRNGLDYFGLNSIFVSAQKQGQTADQRTGRAGKEAYSRACIHKKIGGLNSRTQEPRKEELARAINELRQELRLSVKYIIDVINTNPGLPHISRSNYYYQTHKLDKDSGNQKLMDRIKEIFLEHSQRYGYRRIYGQLRREDYEVNHKKVQRLMQKMGLFAISIRKKRKYSSYYGVQGKIKPDLINLEIRVK